MTESGLREQLEEIVRRKYADSFARAREREAADAALSDEDWWERHRMGRTPMSEEALEEYKQDSLQHRHDRLRFFQNGGDEEIIQREVDSLMPHILALREESGAQGELTQDEYYAASMNNSRSSVGEMLEKFRGAAATAKDPFRKQVLEMFTSNIEADQADFQRLADPTTVTEEDVQEVSIRVSERLQKLTEMIEKRRP